MRVITVASGKGGSGKSTITGTLAVQASNETKHVAMVDLNIDQGNLTRWHMTRGQMIPPSLADEVDSVPDTIRQLRAQGVEWCFIDTPPVHMDLIEQAVQLADCVIIPVRASIFDATSIDAVVDMCQKHRKRFSFVLSAVDKRKAFEKLLSQTVSYISKFGPVCTNQVTYSDFYIRALTGGRSGPEISKTLVPEIEGLWAEVKRLAEGEAK